jgi:hypothetical protein
MNNEELNTTIRIIAGIIGVVIIAITIATCTIQGTTICAKAAADYKVAVECNI